MYPRVKIGLWVTKSSYKSSLSKRLFARVGVRESSLIQRYWAHNTCIAVLWHPLPPVGKRSSGLESVDLHQTTVHETTAPLAHPQTASPL